MLPMQTNRILYWVMINPCLLKYVWLAKSTQSNGFSIMLIQMSTIEAISPLTEAIQLSVAPVFLLTAVAGMLNALGTRLARVIDRGRSLEEKLFSTVLDDHPLRPMWTKELLSLGTRKKVINGATALMVLCAVLIGMTVVELFYSTGIQGKLLLSRGVTFTFLAGFGCFIVGCILYLGEILIASRSINFVISSKP